jgi:uncharacterized protein (TIGR03083 family)
MIDEMTSTDVADIAPISHREWAVLAATEFDRVLELFRSLTEDEWSAPTVCAPWDVQAMAGHMLGMVESQASVREFIRTARVARRAGGSFIDALTALQVDEHAPMARHELVSRLTELAPKAVRARRRTPAPLRAAVRIPQDAPFAGEKVSLGYIYDTLSTRDPWTHRLDICRATGRDMVLTPDHDGRLIADVVAEWARRHGQPFALTLTGTAGGRWHHGTGGERLELDALEFCWVLSGREDAGGLLATPVPF